MENVVVFSDIFLDSSTWSSEELAQWVETIIPSVSPNCLKIIREKPCDGALIAKSISKVEDWCDMLGVTSGEAEVLSDEMTAMRTLQKWKKQTKRNKGDPPEENVTEDDVAALQKKMNKLWNEQSATSAPPQSELEIKKERLNLEPQSSSSLEVEEEIERFGISENKIGDKEADFENFVMDFFGAANENSVVKQAEQALSDACAVLDKLEEKMLRASTEQKGVGSSGTATDQEEYQKLQQFFDEVFCSLEQRPTLSRDPWVGNSSSSSDSDNDDGDVVEVSSSSRRKEETAERQKDEFDEILEEAIEAHEKKALLVNMKTAVAHWQQKNVDDGGGSCVVEKNGLAKELDALRKELA